MSSYGIVPKESQIIGNKGNFGAKFNYNEKSIFKYLKPSRKDRTIYQYKNNYHSLNSLSQRMLLYIS